MIKFHGISMPEGAALSWPLPDIVIRRKNGFAFRCRVRGCSLLDQRPVSALPRRRRERYRQTTSPEGVKIGRRSVVKFGSRLTDQHYPRFGEQYRLPFPYEPDQDDGKGL